MVKLEENRKKIDISESFWAFLMNEKLNSGKSTLYDTLIGLLDHKQYLEFEKFKKKFLEKRNEMESQD